MPACLPPSLGPPLQAPTFTMAGGLLRGEKHLQRLPCDPCSLCVPEVSPVHSHLCFPLACFPGRLSRPEEQRERVTHPGAQSSLCLAPAFPDPL